MEDEKTYTIKSAEAELTKLRNARQKKLDKIKELNLSAKEDHEKIVELQAIYDQLVNEQIKAAVNTRLLAGDKFFKPTIQKILNIANQMNSKVENLDSEKVVKAIEAALDQLQNEQVDTMQDEVEEQEDSEQEDDSISQN
jgi:hypothetical protein